MKHDILAAAAALDDAGLLARLGQLARAEREATAELVGHLAALEGRANALAARGYGSLFAYCRQALGLSEDAACNRIEAARACRRYPVVLEMLATGAIGLSAVRLLGRHLTEQNHRSVLERAAGRSRREVEALVAELAPQPDVPSSVRRLAGPRPPALAASATSLLPLSAQGLAGSRGASAEPASAPAPPATGGPPPWRAKPPSVVRLSAPARYRVQFTVGEETHGKLRRLQALLRREIPDGDPAAIVDRALSLLLARVERAKLGVGARPRRAPAIRPGTDKVSRDSGPSRTVPRRVRREVWRRDGGQCAFVAVGGRRCTETAYLEFHHVEPYARGGPASVANIALRCSRHNRFEAELAFGAGAVRPRASQGRGGVDSPSP